MDNFLKKLKKFGKKVEAEFPQINSGGCGHFAAKMGAHLALRFRTRIAVGSWSADESVNIDQKRGQVRNNKDAWNDHGVYFTHVIVEFEYKGKTYHYDTSYLTEKQPYTKNFNAPIYEGRFTVPEMKQLADEANGWNSSFNRNEIPKIDQMIEEFFAKAI